MDYVIDFDSKEVDFCQHMTLVEELNNLLDLIEVQMKQLYRDLNFISEEKAWMKVQFNGKIYKINSYYNKSTALFAYWYFKKHGGFSNVEDMFNDDQFKANLNARSSAFHEFNRMVSLFLILKLEKATIINVKKFILYKVGRFVSSQTKEDVTVKQEAAAFKKILSKKNYRLKVQVTDDNKYFLFFNTKN